MVGGGGGKDGASVAIQGEDISGKDCGLLSWLVMDSGSVVIDPDGLVLLVRHSPGDFSDQGGIAPLRSSPFK